MRPSVEQEVLAARSGAALFFSEGPPARTVVDVRGSDAARWLDGMISNDVTAIAPDSERSGCYATLLSTKGRIVADLHVLARDEGYWLDTAAGFADVVVERLSRYIVADDVALQVAGIDRIGCEGPRARALIEAAAGASLEALAPEAWRPLSLAGTAIAAARFGWTGEDSYQLFAPAGTRAGVVAALESAAAAAGGGLVRASEEAFEILRIEAGVPRLGLELDEEVFPDEARLESAISRTKGCYTGQEIVARLHSRGAVNHLLVCLRFEGPEPPAPGCELSVDGRRTGEVTSACVSPTAGAIGLGYVRREHAAPGQELRAGTRRATVAEPPLVKRAEAGGVAAVRA